MPTRTSLVPLVLALALASTSARAHAPAPSAAQEATKAETPTPRALYERAYFAEEHDHDLAAAEAGYRAAAEAAEKSGDTALASQARAALARVLARQGKTPAEEPPGQLFPQAQRLIAEGAATDDLEQRAKIADDLLVFGPALVPVLGLMLTLPAPTQIGVGEYVAPVNPAFAASVLARLDAPEAIAALESGLASPDPLVRKAVIEQLRVHAHAALLRRAAADPVPSLRAFAFAKLSELGDPELRALMIEAAREGQAGAVEWLRRWDALALLDLMEEGSVSDTRAPSWGGYPALTSAVVAVLAHRSRAAQRPAVRSTATEMLSNLLEQAHASQDAAQRASLAAVEDVVAREVRTQPSPESMSWLEHVSPERAFEVVAGLLESGEAPLDEAEQKAYSQLLHKLAREEPQPGTFDAWLRGYRAAVRRTPPEQRGARAPVAEAIAAGITRRIEAGVSDADVLAWIEVAKTDERATELSRHQIVQWLAERHKRARPEGEFPAAIRPVASFVLERPWDDLAHSTALAAMRDLDDPRALEPVLDRHLRGAASHPFSQQVWSVGSQLAARDPEHAANVIRSRLAPALGAERLSAEQHRELRTIAWLPAAEALATWKWAREQATTDAARAALVDVLVNLLEGREATAVVLEHYASLSPEGDGSDLRSTAIGRFAEELYEPAIPVLGEALADPNESVRSAAREASEAFKQQRQALEEFEAWTRASAEARSAIDELKALLADSNRDVVLGAVKALGVVQARTALPELVRLLAGDDAELKAAVQEAIDRIGR